METRFCKNCKAELINKRSDAIFCSKKCKNQFFHIYKRCQWYLCKYCGTMFPCNKHRKSNVRDKKFCSNKCKNKYFNRHSYKKQFKSNQYVFNRDKILNMWKNESKNLTDKYIINILINHGTNLKSEDIKQYPELIKAKRQQIKIIREFKN